MYEYVCRWLIRITNDELDRAVADGEAPGGFVEVYIHRHGRVLGACIVSNRAGELVCLCLYVRVVGKGGVACVCLCVCVWEGIVVYTPAWSGA